MSGQIQYGSAPFPTSVQTLGENRSEEECHFTAPVRFGRRKTDQVGHLLFTSGWLKFHGTVDISVAWAEVSRVDHHDGFMIVSLHGTRRTLCFLCQTEEDAARGSVVATHLAALAQSEPYQTA